MLSSFQHDEIDNDILNDLLTEVTELYEASEQTLIELELKPKDIELQRALFRSVHTIKGDLGLVSFKPLLPLLQHSEDLLDLLRNGRIQYTSTMSDLVLLIMDQVKQFVIACKTQGSANYDASMYQNLCEVIKQISPTNITQHESLLQQAVGILAPERAGLQANQLLSSDITPSKVFDFHSLPELKRNDIILFRQLIQAVEKHRFNESGYSDHILKFALAMNHNSGNTVPPEQLMVACYLHGFGFGFLPQDEAVSQRSHVYKSAKLIEHLSYWDTAHEIIMQYKERYDGSGYPMGLSNDQISIGARLLGVVDCYFQRLRHYSLNLNATQYMKIALVELNKHDKHRVCPFWLNELNNKIAAQIQSQ